MAQWNDWALKPEDAVFASEWWQTQYADLVNEFAGEIPDDFLVKLWYRGGFFMDDLDVYKEELRYCRDHFGFADVLRLTNGPRLPHVVRNDTPFNSTTVHHLHHLARWENATGKDLRSLHSIVEWGAGYGSFARLCMLRNPELRYQMIDLPLCGAIALRYLDVCGYRDQLDSHQIWTRPPSQAFDLLNADLFVSTWALDESSRFAQERVQAADYFGATSMLIAYHPDKDIFPDSQPIETSLPGKSTELAVKGSYYLFA